MLYFLGEYKTNEAKNAHYFADADDALVSGSSGQPAVEKKQEWFI